MEIFGIILIFLGVYITKEPSYQWLKEVSITKKYFSQRVTRKVIFYRLFCRFLGTVVILLGAFLMLYR